MNIYLDMKEYISKSKDETDIRYMLLYNIFYIVALNYTINILILGFGWIDTSVVVMGWSVLRLS